MFWGYQMFIVLAAVGYLYGVTQSREYAEARKLSTDDAWMRDIGPSFVVDDHGLGMTYQATATAFCHKRDPSQSSTMTSPIRKLRTMPSLKDFAAP